MATLPDMAKRVLFVTGFADHDDIREFLLRTIRPFFKKPVELTELVKVVRKVAEGRA